MIQCLRNNSDGNGAVVHQIQQKIFLYNGRNILGEKLSMEQVSNAVVVIETIKPSH